MSETSFSQPSGVYFALNQFLNTDFFREYNELRENDAARVIQKKMMHWLWAPYTRDGKFGLMVARGMKECGVEFPS